jgi:uncharacterized protein YcgL (UPF0745 family)
MRVDIYKARKPSSPSNRQYVFVPKGQNISTLPEHLKKLRLDYEKTLDIQPGEKRIALNTDEAITNIKKVGYYTQSTKIEIKERVGSQ